MPLTDYEREAPTPSWDEVFRKITEEADRDIWRKQGLRLTWREVVLLASVLRSIDGLPFSNSSTPSELRPPSGERVAGGGDG